MPCQRARFVAMMIGCSVIMLTACVSRDGSLPTAPDTAPTDVRVARDLSQFGGGSPLVFDAFPVDASAVDFIRSMGTVDEAHVLPSPDAVIVPRTADSVTVRAMIDGVITELDREHGTLTMRVRAYALLRLSGFAIDTSLAVGRIVRARDALGEWRANEMARGIGVRVLDARVHHVNWILPERYGARQSAAFFARYLTDSLRSAAFSLVRRAAPDLDGRIDYDRDGRLVGTWFDSPSVVANAARSSDPSEQLAPSSLSFVYDAERPGQVRVTIGSALTGTIGASGVYAVAWDDADPASVNAEQGVVRYHLFATHDEARIGRAPLTLIAQMVDGRTIRVEVVSRTAFADANAYDGVALSKRAITLVR